MHYSQAVNSGPHEVDAGFQEFDPMKDPAYQDRYRAPRGNNR